MPIRACTPADFDAIFAVVNDAAVAYRGIIAADCWQEPYMPREELRHEVADGVRFWGFFEGDELLGVMGLQDAGDVALIRHAYTRSAAQGKGIGTALLEHLQDQTDRPLLVGTWKAATWAIRFYERHGFRVVDPGRTTELLRRYWSVSARQIEESVVLEATGT
jgi:GNAT superfamily N-acetyltransferase